MQDLLAELFSSRVRAAVLSLLLPRPHLRFSLTDMSRRLGLPVSSLQHECYKLARLGLLQDERAGNARFYRPDPGWPLLEPLTSLVVRALPLPESLAAAVEGVPRLETAWLAGEPAGISDAVYLVVIGNLCVEEIDGMFGRARIALAHTAASNRVELAFFRPVDWEPRLAAGDRFASSLIAQRSIALHPPEPAQPEAPGTAAEDVH